MEVALRRRLEGVATISISQQRQTAAVVFAPGPHVFSPGEFRAAVAEADVDVIGFEIDACGRLEPHDGVRWFVAGPNRFIVNGGALHDSGTAHTACISAALDDRRGGLVLLNARQND